MEQIENKEQNVLGTGFKWKDLYYDYDKEKSKFEGLQYILVGNPKQFFTYMGKVFCVRECSASCPYFQNGCEMEEEKTLVERSLTPHPRRGIGIEDTPFLLLRWKKDEEGKPYTWNSVPMKLWDNPYSDIADYEYNVHFVFRDRKCPIWTIKGQLRFYGTREEFENSAYAEWMEYYSEYTPAHSIACADFSAIEPRITTLVTKEEEYLKTFEGSEKDVAREVRFED